MRRSVIVSVAVLLFVAAVGGLAEGYNGDVALRYGDSLRPLGAAISQEDWQEAQRLADAVFTRWEGETAWIQLWINHADTDAVTRALRSLQTAIRARDALSAQLYLGDCVENFAHLHHRDAFTLKNIL